MSKLPIESIIAAAIVCKPTSLKELQSFMGVVNYIKDQPRSDLQWLNHYTTWYRLNNETKSLAWTPDGHIAFEKLKSLVNNYPKVYVIDYNLPVILFTDASDFAHEAYLCQIRTRLSFSG